MGPTIRFAKVFRVQLKFIVKSTQTLDTNKELFTQIQTVCCLNVLVDGGAVTGPS